MFYARTTVVARRGTESRAKQLASLALQRLARQGALHVQDSIRNPEAWIGVAQLRDDVLRDEFQPARRQRLWDAVQKKVENNANVRSMVREGRSGEVGRVWEWIGAVDLDAIEDVGTPRPALLGNGTPIRGEGYTPSPGGLVKREEEANAGRSRSSGLWDEGRPIY